MMKLGWWRNVEMGAKKFVLLGPRKQAPLLVGTMNFFSAREIN
jgi:hypothetical protein